MAKLGVALQLFGVRDEMQKDAVGTLRAVAGMGYRAVELVSYYGTYGLSAAELKRTLGDLGLTPIGVHLRTADLQERFEETAVYYRDAGAPEMVVATLPHEYYESADGFRRGGALLGELARRCRAAGVGLSYHNHYSEFERVGDGYGLDLIFEGAGGEDVGLEADVYWITHAGADAVAVLRRYADRCRFVHLKDRPAGLDAATVEAARAGQVDRSRMFAEVGEGSIDWRPIFAAAEATPAKWYVVEQDASARGALESAAISLRHLKEWGKA
jgi:sugar phosphate isomerase/epimerase